MLSGNDSDMIASSKSSLPSNIPSSFIETSNVTLVTPAGNGTSNIPGP